MKKIILLTCVLSVFFLGLANATKSKNHVHGYARMNVFYFKVDKEFLGAELEIFSEDSVQLIAQKISKRKVLIDFYYENPGKYTIRLKKGNELEQFSFTKDTPCLETDRPAELIPVIQGI